MILVLGSTGAIGAAVVDELERRGVPVRAMAEAEVADLLAVANAMRGVDRLFLDHDEPAQAIDALSIAERGGAYHAVLVADGRAEVVDHLQLSSLRWTLLEGAGGIDPRDAGAIAARALTEEGHENSAYALGEPGVVEALLGPR